MIETVGLARSFDGKAAVQDLSLKIDDGEVFGLLGPNGAGKTTTIRMLACLIRQTSGTAFVNGYEINKGAESQKIRSIVGVLPESPGLYESMSAYDNLDFFAHLYGVPKDKREKRIEELLRLLDLWDRKDDIVATYSKGMKQKIAIARAFAHDPQVVFLDEPTAGLDPEASMTVREFLIALKREGRTVFINSHHLDEVERLCDRIAIMDRTAIAVGSPKELVSRYWNRTTVIELLDVRDEFIDLLRGFDFVSNLRTEHGRILVDLDDPEMRNPVIIEALARAGAKVEYVTDLKRPLEEVYIKLVRGGSR